MCIGGARGAGGWWVGVGVIVAAARFGLILAVMLAVVPEAVTPDGVTVLLLVGLEGVPPIDLRLDCRVRLIVRRTVCLWTSRSNCFAMTFHSIPSAKGSCPSSIRSTAWIWSSLIFGFRPRVSTLPVSSRRRSVDGSWSASLMTLKPVVLAKPKNSNNSFHSKPTSIPLALKSSFFLRQKR